MKILHVFRAPVGGLFRHVRDLARGQAAAGHEVGLICDSAGGGAMADSLLAASLPHCKLGIHRMRISRLPGFGDARAILSVRMLAKRLRVDVVHGHGAKGGLHARLAASTLSIPSFYTPHGGSLHYDWGGPAGFAFLCAEWALARIGSGILFVCEFEKAQFERKLGIPPKPVAVVHNGLWPEEFVPQSLSPDASDFVFIGELRPIKGVDVLVEALALINQQRRATATIVGDGPAQRDYETLVQKRGLSSVVTFAGRLPALEALSLGQTLVLPSRAESFPYVVLEAAAQGKPVVASSVGGLSEVLPPSCLVPANDSIRLASRLTENLAGPSEAGAAAKALLPRLRSEFSAALMAHKVSAFYADTVATLRNGTLA